MDVEYDYIVVGGGASGCVLAARLGDRLPGARIALVEAGHRRRSPVFAVPALGAFAPFVRGVNWNHPTEPNAALDGRSIPLFQGRLIGGSGAINGMVVTRGHPADYDAWRDAGCPGWAHADVLPYFRRLESNWRGEGPLHGGDGPIGVRQNRPASPLAGLFLAAAEAAGYALSEDLNAGEADVFGLTDVNIAAGRRSAAHVAHLRLAGGNVDILPGHHVLGLVFQGERVSGITALCGHRQVTLRARREVILCAGGINTPHLLLLSGIGPKRQLEAAGVRVVADSPEVGENLQNHPSVPLRYRLSQPLSLKRYAEPVNGLAAGMEYLFRRSGVLAENLFPVAGFIRTDPALPAPDAQVVMSPVLMPKLPAPLRDLLPRRHGLTMIVQQGTPFSRGRVSLASADPLVRPLIETGAFSDARDMAVAIAAVGKAAAIMRQAPMAAIVEGCESDLSSRESIAAAIRQTAGTAYHQCGTCRMSDAGGVVDTQLRVRGVEGLRIADGSVMPLIPNAALHAPTLMIAERAADLVAGGAGQRLQPAG